MVETRKHSRHMQAQLLAARYRYAEQDDYGFEGPTERKNEERQE